jgi:hypothetical protein
VEKFNDRVDHKGEPRDPAAAAPTLTRKTSEFQGSTEARFEAECRVRAARNLAAYCIDGKLETEVAMPGMVVLLDHAGRFLAAVS